MTSDWDLEDICEKIESGEWTYAQIAKGYGRTQGALSLWLAADPNRSARARLAKEVAAQYWDNKADEIISRLQFIAKDESSFELAKAKELAHHYRWRAKSYAPGIYGDKVAVGGDPNGAPIKHAVDIAFVGGLNAGS